MRAQVMRRGPWSLAVAVMLAIAGMPQRGSAQPPVPAPVKDVFMRNQWERILPPYLDTEPNLSLYGGYTGGGANGREPFSNFGMTKYLFMPDGVIFLNGEGFVTQYARGGATALLHSRQLIGGSLIGTGVSYTVHESPTDQTFEQGAVHLEVFPSNDWSLRANGYIPTGARARQIFNSGPVPGLPGFSGNNIVVPTATTTLDETTMRGYEVELARKIGSYAAEVYGSWYQYFGRNGGRDTDGGRFGVRGYVTRRLSANVNISDDPLFGTQVFGGVSWAFGGGAGLAPQTLRDKLTSPVERHRQIVLTKSGNVVPGSVTVTDGGVPITVSHVEEGAAGGNLGTFADPFNTNMLPATQPTQIVYVHAGGNYLNGYTLDTDQRLLGEGSFNRHLIDTDQFGPIFLPPGNGGFVRPIVQGTVTAANGSEISNFNMQPVGTALALPGLTGMVNVNRTTVTGGTTAIDVTGGSGDFLFTGVDVTDPTTTGINIAGGSANITFGSLLTDPPTGQFGASTIMQSAAGSAVMVGGGHTGMLLVNVDSTIDATAGTGLQFDDADGTYTFDGPVVLNGGDAGIDILGGSAGTFTFADTDITSPTGTGVQIGTPGAAGSGGTANVTFATGSSLVQANAATALGIFGDHSGVFTFEGPITATGGDGLQFGDAIGTAANGMYNLSGTVALNGGDAGIDILGPSTGTFTFADTTITSPTGTAFNVDGSGGTSEATVNYTGGAIVQTNNATMFNVLDHDTGTLTIDVNIAATNGDGLQFSNADGTYDFNGTMLLDGGDAGIDILGGSDGVFTFRRPTIIKPSGGPAINLVGGTAAATFEGFNITTTSTTGLNIDSTGVTTVLTNADITTTGAPALDINNAQVNLMLRNVISDSSTAEGVDIDGTLAGSTVTVTGLTRILNATGSGIDIAGSEGTFSFTNTDIDGTGGVGINLTGNSSITSVLFDGGQIDDVAGGNDAIHIENTNEVTINNILFGFATPVSGNAINYISNDAIARSVTLTNNQSVEVADVLGSGIVISQGAAGQIDAVVTDNDLSTTGQTFVTSDFGSAANPLVLQIDNNSWETDAIGFASEVVASAMDSTIITSLAENSSSGTFLGGGMLFDQVTFDSSGTLLAGVQVQAPGTTSVSAFGDGLSFINPTGDLSFGQINISNSGGTGLEVFTKGPPATTFNLEVGSGSISTFGGPALFLDPLTANIQLDSVQSSGSVVLGGPVGNFSADGNGVFVDELVATGGPGANALTIGALTVDSPAGHGVRIEDSQGQFTFQTVDIDGTGGDAISLVDNNDAATRVTIDGGTIHNTAAGVDAINSVNTALTVRDVRFGNVVLDVDGNPIFLEPVGGDGIDILHNDDVNRSYQIQSVTSAVDEDPVGMVDVAQIRGRGINFETGAASTGTASVILQSNNVAAADNALRVNTNGNPNVNLVSLSLSNNTFQTLSAAPGPRTVELIGTNVSPVTNSLRMTQFRNTTITGNLFGGGMRVENATFSGFVSGGTTNIGDMSARVAGSGLELINTSGSLNFNELNIFNDATTVPGVGLLVDTKGAGTIFSLSTSAGTIDSTGGLAMFLDPLTVNMTLGTVTSSNSVGGPNAASAGDGVYLEDVVGQLTIADLQVATAAGDGLHLIQGAGVGTFDLELTMVGINGTGTHGIFVEDTAGFNSTTVTIGGLDDMGMLTDSTIDMTGGDGININNMDTAGSLFRMDRTTFTGITGFTGDITNSIITGAGNVDAMFSQGPGVGNTGSILFNDGADLLQ